MRSSPPIMPKSRRTSQPRARDSATSPPSIYQMPTRLKQIQYRSYQCSIHIYHFRATQLSVGDFRSLLTRDPHGYVDSLISRDTLAKLHPSEGDEIPPDCIEVAYLPNVFTRGRTKLYGCALGFRVNDRIDWMCFDQDIEKTILASWIWTMTDAGVQVGALPGVHADNPRKLFDLVAEMPKGLTTRRIRGANEEHKRWHDALWGAKLRKFRVKLTWKNYTVNLMRHQAAQRAEVEGEVDLQEARNTQEQKEKDMDDEMMAEALKYQDLDLDVEMTGGYVW